MPLLIPDQGTTMKKAIIRNATCNYKYDIVVLVKKNDVTYIDSTIKEGITLKAAQAYFGVDDTAKLRDSEGDRI
jgi:hypothetical protein